MEAPPITDFWQIAKGTAARLSKYGVYDMEGIARAPQEFQELLPSPRQNRFRMR